MGLDQYLNRAPRYKDLTIDDINKIDAYLNWKNDENVCNKYTVEQWCGISKNKMPSKEAVKYFEQFYTIKYYHWDNKHEYGRGGIIDHVGYWRKANQIHAWFVENVQDGEDDCGCYEVEKWQLEELLDICKLIKDKCKLVDGTIKTGEHLKNGNWVPDYEDGKVIDNPDIAEQYLPTKGGFFFGSTDYDEWYMQDIDDTIMIIENVLKETDFDTQIVYYSSSW